MLIVLPGGEAEIINGRANGTAQRGSSVLIVLPSGEAEIINGRVMEQHREEKEALC